MQKSILIDRFIRHGLIGKYIPTFKENFPRLYTIARKYYESTFYLKSKKNIARYQALAIHNFLKKTGITPKNSTILEVGSDLNGYILKEFQEIGFKSCVGINPALSSGDEESINKKLPINIKIMNGDVRKLIFDDNTFDAIFSIAVFEHLNDFEQCLNEMFRVLKPNGFVYAQFGPIWSSSVGHHVYAIADGLEARHWKPETNPIPNYAHLFHDKHEMQLLLKDKAPKNLLGEIISWVYEKDDINRLFYEDYKKYFKSSKFRLISLIEEEEYIGENVKKMIKAKNPSYSIFNVRNAEVVLQKCV